MEHVNAGHTSTKANKVFAGTVVERGSDVTDYKQQKPSKSVVRRPMNIKSKIEQALADLGTVR